MNTELERDGRSTAVVLAIVGAVVVAALLAMFWLLNSASSLPLKGAVAKVAVTTSASTAQPIAPAATTTVVPPKPGWTPPSITPSLAPAEQPTLRDPVPGQTADPDPNAPAPAPPPPPNAPKVSDVSLTCQKDDKKTVAKLSFTTTERVEVTLQSGDAVDKTQAGPGRVTMSNSGKGNPVCSAVVDGHPVGPVNAS